MKQLFLSTLRLIVAGSFFYVCTLVHAGSCACSSQTTIKLCNNTSCSESNGGLIPCSWDIATNSCQPGTKRSTIESNVGSGQESFHKCDTPKCESALATCNSHNPTTHGKRMCDNEYLQCCKDIVN
jgi:hypothetical protein